MIYRDEVRQVAADLCRVESTLDRAMQALGDPLRPKSERMQRGALLMARIDGGELLEPGTNADHFRQLKKALEAGAVAREGLSVSRWHRLVNAVGLLHDGRARSELLGILADARAALGTLRVMVDSSPEPGQPQDRARGLLAWLGIEP